MQPDSAINHPAYHEALRWLYALSANPRSAAEIVADHPRKLDRMRALLDRLGNPERAFASVLVVGTKGKGSIAAIAEAILRAAGRRTGLVTSPHLVSWCERTRIDGADLTPDAAARQMPRVRAAVACLVSERPELGQPTTFEAGLAVSLLAFAEASVEIAVVEAGVGGRHDATNVLDPLAVALGPVSYDHTHTLGSTLSAIAAEKAGIIRTGRLAISASQPPEARAVVEQVGRERGGRLEWLGRDWFWLPEDDQPGRGRFTVAGPRGHFRGLTSPLLGRHQRENAAVAVALATDVLAPGGATTATLDDWLDAAVRRGLASVRWPGRLQVLRERPWLVVDGAHNGDSAVRLVEALGDCFAARRYHLVFGTSVGKDVPRMLDALLPGAASVTLTRSHHERSVPLEELVAAVTARGVRPAVELKVGTAVARALARCGLDDLAIVTGSLFVVGEALEAYAPAPLVGAAAGSAR